MPLRRQIGLLAQLMQFSHVQSTYPADLLLERNKSISGGGDELCHACSRLPAFGGLCERQATTMDLDTARSESPVALAQRRLLRAAHGSPTTRPGSIRDPLEATLPAR